jgi:hypothetical protein
MSTSARRRCTPFSGERWHAVAGCTRIRSTSGSTLHAFARMRHERAMAGSAEYEQSRMGLLSEHWRGPRRTRCLKVERSGAASGSSWCGEARSRRPSPSPSRRMQSSISKAEPHASNSTSSKRARERLRSELMLIEVIRRATGRSPETPCTRGARRRRSCHHANGTRGTSSATSSPPHRSMHSSGRPKRGLLFKTSHHPARRVPTSVRCS